MRYQLMHYIPLLCGGRQFLNSDAFNGVKYPGRLRLYPGHYTGDVYAALEITVTNTDGTYSGTVNLESTAGDGDVLASVTVPAGANKSYLRSSFSSENIGGTLDTTITISPSDDLSNNSITVHSANVLLKQLIPEGKYLYTLLTYRDMSGDDNATSSSGAYERISGSKSFKKSSTRATAYDDTEILEYPFVQVAFVDPTAESSGKVGIGYKSDFTTPITSAYTIVYPLVQGLNQGTYNISPNASYYYDIVYKGANSIDFYNGYMVNKIYPAIYDDHYEDQAYAIHRGAAVVADVLLVYDHNAGNQIRSISIDGSTGDLTTRYIYTVGAFSLTSPPTVIGSDLVRPGYTEKYCAYVGNGSTYLYTMRDDALLTQWQELTTPQQYSGTFAQGSYYFFSSDATSIRAYTVNTTTNNLDLKDTDTTIGGQAHDMYHDGNFLYVCNAAGFSTFSFDGTTLTYIGTMADSVGEHYSMGFLATNKFVSSSGVYGHVISVDGSGNATEDYAFKWADGESKYLTALEGYVHSTNYAFGTAPADIKNEPISTYQYNPDTGKLDHMGCFYGWQYTGIPFVIGKGFCYAYAEDMFRRVPWNPLDSASQGKIKSYRSFRPVSSKVELSTPATTYRREDTTRIVDADFALASSSPFDIRMWFLKKTSGDTTQSLYNRAGTEIIEARATGTGIVVGTNNLADYTSNNELICPYYYNSGADIYGIYLRYDVDTYFPPPAVVANLVSSVSLGDAVSLLRGFFGEWLSSLALSSGVAALLNTSTSITSNVDLSSAYIASVTKHIGDLVSGMNLDSAIVASLHAIGTILSDINASSAMGGNAGYLGVAESNLNAQDSLDSLAKLKGILSSLVSIGAPLQGVRKRTGDLISNMHLSSPAALLRAFIVTLLSSMDFNSVSSGKGAYLFKASDSLAFTEDHKALYSVDVESDLLLSSSLDALIQTNLGAYQYSKVKISQAEANVTLGSSGAEVSMKVPKVDVTINFINLRRQ